MLADAEVELGAAWRSMGLNRVPGPEVDAGVAGEVSSSGDEARDACARRGEALVDRLARGELGASFEGGKLVSPARESPPG